MPKIACTTCQELYVMKKRGVVVEEIASFGSYKLWHADLWECPSCGGEVISGFADRNFAVHHQPDYKTVRKKEADRQGGLFYFR